MALCSRPQGCAMTCICLAWRSDSFDPRKQNYLGAIRSSWVYYAVHVWHMSDLAGRSASMYRKYYVIVDQQELAPRYI